MGREYMGASEGVWGHLTALSARAQGGNKTPPCLCHPHLGAAVSSFKYKMVSSVTCIYSRLDKISEGKKIFLFYYHHFDKRVF